jgi:hypothetical protein
MLSSARRASELEGQQLLGLAQPPELGGELRALLARARVLGQQRRQLRVAAGEDGLPARAATRRCRPLSAMYARTQTP